MGTTACSRREGKDSAWGGGGSMGDEGEWGVRGGMDEGGGGEWDEGLIGEGQSCQ